MKRNLIKNTSIILVLCLTLVTSLFSQNTNKVIPDSRLYQCFEKSYVDNLLMNNPEKIAYYNFYLDHSYYTASLKATKEVLGKDIHALLKKSKAGKLTDIKFNEVAYDKKTFNVLQYNFETGEMSTPNYIWNEAGIVIVFYPEKTIREEYKKFIKTQK